MANTYSFLSTVYHYTTKEIRNNPSFLFLIFLTISIPFPIAVNNVVFGLFVLITLFTFKKQNIYLSKELLLPIFLYGLMCLSLFWSIDFDATKNALPKELFLLVIPICFIIMPKFGENRKQKLIEFYSYAMVLVTIFFLIRAIIRFVMLSDTNVFFYHGENDIDSGLVPKLLNAIHVSVFMAIAFFYFLKKERKNVLDYISQFLLFLFIILLSSKNIILVVLLLVVLFYLYFSNTANKLRLRNLFIFLAIIVVVISFGKLKNRFEVELNTNSGKSLSSSVVSELPQGVHNISIAEAWHNESFTTNDYFPGTAFRVYQLRMFLEIMSENNKWISGFGLNASQKMLELKGQQYNVYEGDSTHEGYQKKNFHNQYIQVFAELGIVGFLILIIMLLITFRKALKNKDFIRFSFAVLMISLFLTESFLWRQRGVVFFTIFYCVFNTNSIKIAATKIE